MTNHLVCQKLRGSLGHGTCSAKQGTSQENWERLVTLAVLVSRFLVQATGPDQFHGGCVHLDDCVDHDFKLSH